MKTLTIKEAEALSRYNDTIMREYQIATKRRSREVTVSDMVYSSAVITATSTVNLETDENRDILLKIKKNYEIENKEQEAALLDQMQKIEDDKRKIIEESEKRIQQIHEDAQKSIDEISTPKCPKCGSKNLYVDKKGFSTEKAAVGALIFGVVGLAAGTIGSNKIQYTCLSCGKQWDIN